MPKPYRLYFSFGGMEKARPRGYLNGLRRRAIALPWCGRWDSNPHGFLHQNLNLACLPFHHARMYIS